LAVGAAVAADIIFLLCIDLRALLRQMRQIDISHSFSLSLVLL